MQLLFEVLQDFKRIGRPKEQGFSNNANRAAHLQWRTRVNLTKILDAMPVKSSHVWSWHVGSQLFQERSYIVLFS
jgi:hypothetical protein